MYNSMIPTWRVSQCEILPNCRTRTDFEPDFCSEKMLEGWKKDPNNTVTADELLDLYIGLYNDCISKIPDDMHVGVHLCRG